MNWLAGPEAPAPPLRVAVLASGSGHEALLFARAGHAVTGFDFAPSAISAARARAARAGLEVRFEQADIFTLPSRSAGAFDVVVEHTCFCAIDPSRREAYVTVVRELLVPGGRLVGLFFAHGRPGGPPFSTSAKEVRRLFQPAFAVDRLEVARDSIPDRANEELFAVMRKLG